MSTKAGITVEVRCPQGAVAFQSQVPIVAETARFVQKELMPETQWSWKILPVSRDELGILAVQSTGPCTVFLNDVAVELEGQRSTDFGIIYARRGSESLGSLPFAGDLTSIRVQTPPGKKVRVDILLAEADAFVPEPPAPEPPPGNIVDTPSGIVLPGKQRAQEMLAAARAPAATPTE